MSDRKARTVGVLAKALNQPIHRIEYLLRHRPHIKPIGRAGRTRLYSSEAEAQLRYEINLLDAKSQEVRS